MAVALASSLVLAAEAHADKIPTAESLVPVGEKQLMAPHPVEPAKIAYKPGKGLWLGSADGLFALTTRLRVQLLSTVEKASDDPSELGLMLRRARVQFEGHAFGKHNQFKVELAVSPNDLRMTELDGTVVTRESPLLSWFADFDHLRDATVRIGQYKIPFSRQRVISSGNLQMVDRSIANAEFNLDRDIGIELRSKDLFGLGLLRYSAGVYNGEGRSAFDNGDRHLLYLARLELLPLGMFKDYSEADFQRLARPGLSLGVAYAYAPRAELTHLNQGRVPADGGTTDFHTVAADAMVKYLGFTLQAELFYRTGKRQNGGDLDGMGILIPTQPVRKGYGWMAQAGYLLPGQPIELAGRFSQVKGIGTTSLSDLNAAGGALSFCFARHPFKLQADVFQLWGEDFGDGTTRIRVQLQLAL